MKHRHPLAETYIQNLKTDKDSVVVPASDQYFLGRLDLSDGVEDQLFEKETGLKLKALNPFPSLFSRKFMPLGFAQMVMLDRDFQKKNYDFKFVRQEFLGEVRCIVLDVQPKGDARRTLPGPDLGGRPRLQHRPLQRDLFSAFPLQLLPAL